MTPLMTCIHALTGRGVTFYRDNGCSFRLEGDQDFIEAANLAPLKADKALCVLLLPLNKRITARQLYDALESYNERVSIMMLDGGIDKGQAEIQALAPIREWLSRLT